MRISLLWLLSDNPYTANLMFEDSGSVNAGSYMGVDLVPAAIVVHTKAEPNCSYSFRQSKSISICLERLLYKIDK